MARMVNRDRERKASMICFMHESRKSIFINQSKMLRANGEESGLTRMVDQFEDKKPIEPVEDIIEKTFSLF